MAAKQIKVAFSHLNDTKGTRRYQEDGDPEKHKVGSLYIKKSTAADLGNPDSLQVTISAK